MVLKKNQCYNHFTSHRVQLFTFHLLFQISICCMCATKMRSYAAVRTWRHFSFCVFPSLSSRIVLHCSLFRLLFSFFCHADKCIFLDAFYIFWKINNLFIFSSSARSEWWCWFVCLWMSRVYFGSVKIYRIVCVLWLWSAADLEQKKPENILSESQRIDWKSRVALIVI